MPTAHQFEYLPLILRDRGPARFLPAIPGIRRNVGTVQKDWAVVKSYDLPQDLCIAVRGHRGWTRDPEAAARYALAATFEIVGQEIPIYEPLRAAVVELQAEVEAQVEAEATIEV